MNGLKTFFLAVAFSFCTFSAQAHHSVYGTFDVGTLVEIQGIFDSADVVNPHAWFHFKQVDESGNVVLNDEGEPVIWSFETPGPGALRRMGVTEELFERYGDQIFTIYSSPQLDGDTRGLFDLSIFPDGNILIMGTRDDPRFKPILEAQGE